jgi:Zn-dependent peptidase ImmA (M78 family)
MAAIDPWSYAKFLKVLVLDFGSLGLSEKSSRQLLKIDSGSWSAMTLREDGVTALVLNPSHVRSRQCNDLMHELAHVELKHVPTRVDVSPTGLLLLSDYSAEHEQEADWLAGSILLPRDALVAQRRKGRSVEQIAAAYGVSRELTDWRLRMTGADVQLRRSGHPLK